MNKIIEVIKIIKKYWIYIFVFLFCVKCTQNCTNKQIISIQETKIEHLDSIINKHTNKIIKDSIIIYNLNSKVNSLEESLRIFDKAYDVQLKQQESNKKSQNAVNNLIKKVDELDKNINKQITDETK